MANTDAQHPWFKPLWRRVLMVAIPAGMAGWDAYYGNWGWVAIFGATAAYAVYIFFIVWNRNNPPDQTPHEGEDGEQS